MAQNIIGKSSTIHDYSAATGVTAGSGPLTIDGDFTTYWECRAIENGSYPECVGHRTTSYLYSSHTLVKQYTITRVVGKFYWALYISSGASSNTGGVWTQIDIYRDGAWETIPGTYEVRSSSSGYINLDVSGLSLERVTKVRAYINAHGDKQCCDACGGSTTAYGRIYELEAYASNDDAGYCCII